MSRSWFTPIVTYVHIDYLQQPGQARYGALLEQNERMRDRTKSIHLMTVRETFEIDARKIISFNRTWLRLIFMCVCVFIYIYISFCFYTIRNVSSLSLCIHVACVKKQMGSERRKTEEQDGEPKENEREREDLESIEKQRERERERERENVYKTNKTARTHVDSRCDKIDWQRRCRMNWDSIRLHIDRAFPEQNTNTQTNTHAQAHFDRVWVYICCSGDGGSGGE